MDGVVVKSRKGFLDEDSLLDDATRLVARGTITFNGIEDQTLRKWMDQLCPSMKVLDRKTLREYVAMAYAEVTYRMKEEIDAALGVSPGTDGWRDKRGWELE